LAAWWFQDAPEIRTISRLQLVNSRFLVPARQQTPMDSSGDRVEAVGHSLHRAKRWVGPGLPTPDGKSVPTLQENVPRVGAVYGMPAGDPPSWRLCRAQDRRLSVQYPDGLTWAGHQRAWSAAERRNHAAAGVIHPQRQTVRCGSLAKPVNQALSGTPTAYSQRRVAASRCFTLPIKESVSPAVAVKRDRAAECDRAGWLFIRLTLRQMTARPQKHCATPEVLGWAASILPVDIRLGPTVLDAVRACDAGGITDRHVSHSQR